MTAEPDKNGPSITVGLLLVAACIGVLAGPLVGLKQLRDVELLKSSFEERRRGVEDLEKQIQGLTDRDSTLRQELVERERKRAQFGKEGELEVEIARLTVRLAEEEVKLKQTTSEIDAGKTQLTDVGKQVESARSVLAGLDKQTDAVRTRLVSLHDSLSKSQTDLQAANAALASAQRDLESARAEEADIKRRIESSRQDLMATVTKKDSLAAQLTLDEMNSVRLKTEIATLNTSITAAKETMAALSDNLAETTKQKQLLETQLQGLPGKLTTLQQSVVKTSMDLQAGLAELDKTSAQRTKLLGEAADAEKQLASTKNETDSLKKSKAQLTLDTVNLKQTIGTFEARQLELTRQLDQGTKDLAEIQKQIAAAKGELPPTGSNPQKPGDATEAEKPKPSSDTNGSSSK